MLNPFAWRGAGGLIGWPPRVTMVKIHERGARDISVEEPAVGPSGVGRTGPTGHGYGRLLGTVGMSCWSSWDDCAVLLQTCASEMPPAPGGGFVGTTAAPTRVGVKGGAL